MKLAKVHGKQHEMHPFANDELTTGLLDNENKDKSP